MVPPSEFHFFFALHGKIKYYRHELHDFFSMHNAQLFSQDYELHEFYELFFLQRITRIKRIYLIKN